MCARVVASRAPGAEPFDLLGFHFGVQRKTRASGVGAVFDMNKVEFSLLMLVMANPGIVPKRLARALAVTAPKLTLLLDGLQARKLIQRERNAADGRSQHLLLTERGRKLARDAAAAAEPMEREMLGPLSRAEHAMLIELLAKLAGRA